MPKRLFVPKETLVRRMLQYTRTGIQKPEELPLIINHIHRVKGHETLKRDLGKTRSSLDGFFAMLHNRQPVAGEDLQTMGALIQLVDRTRRELAGMPPDASRAGYLHDCSNFLLSFKSLFLSPSKKLSQSTVHMLKIEQYLLSPFRHMLEDSIININAHLYPSRKEQSKLYHAGWHGSEIEAASALSKAFGCNAWIYKNPFPLNTEDPARTYFFSKKKSSISLAQFIGGNPPLIAYGEVLAHLLPALVWAIREDMDKNSPLKIFIWGKEFKSVALTSETTQLHIAIDYETNPKPNRSHSFAIIKRYLSLPQFKDWRLSMDEVGRSGARVHLTVPIEVPKPVRLQPAPLEPAPSEPAPPVPQPDEGGRITLDTEAMRQQTLSARLVSWVKSLRLMKR